MGAVLEQDSKTTSRPRRPLSRRKRLLFGALAVVLALGVGCVLLELATRVLTRTNLVHFGDWESLPGVRFKLRPGVGGYNNHGFHDVDRDFKKPAGTRRVLFLGDSYTWAPVDDDQRFTTIVARDWAKAHPAPPTEFLNLGVPSYGPADTYELWKNHGVLYRPDAAIYCFYQGNDVTDNGPGGYRRAILGELVSIRADRWLDKSWLLDFVRAKLHLTHFALTRDTETAHGLTQADLVADWKFTARLFDPAAQAEVQWHYDYLRAVLADMKRLADEQKTPLLVLQLPAQTRIDPAAARRMADAAGRRVEDFDFALVSLKVKKLCDELGIASADLAGPLAAEPDPAGMYLPNDTHWNGRGNAAAARAMEPAIEKFLNP